MPVENDTPSIIDGAEPTDREAELAAQVNDIGDDPQTEPAAKTDVPAAAATPDATDSTATEPVTTPTDDAATAAATAAAQVSEPAAAPSAAAALPPEPKADVDFEVEHAENLRKFEEGEIDGKEFQTRSRQLTRQESEFVARHTLWQERQQSAAEIAQNQFNEIALKWERENADFMANALRAEQMQRALNFVETTQPNLGFAERLQEAQKIAFEALNWKAADNKVAAPDAAAAVARATQERTPRQVPPTLGNAAAAAPIERPANNTAFASIDALDIDEMENALARMKPADVEAFLRDSPV